MTPPLCRKTIATTSPSYAPFEYLPPEDVEPPERYGPGGYHPISIGDRLSNRYNVVHKLGFGTYSTIWLARDLKRAKYVAVKVGIAEADMSETASEILHTLALSAPEPADQEEQAAGTLIPRLLDTFSLDGPNGRHRCLVTELGMMTMADAKDVSYNRPFSMPVARKIAAQVIQAVAFLHRRGVVHADLHAGNIMFHLPPSITIYPLSPEELYRQHSPPDLEPFERIDGKPIPDGVPTHGVIPLWLGKRSDLVTLPEAKIFITDFGSSFLPSAYFLRHEPLPFPSDIWTLACTLWEVLGQRTLFKGFAPSRDWMVKEHVEALGMLPSDWWRGWEARGNWFTEDAERKSEGEGWGVSRSLDTRFEHSILKPRREGAVEGIGEAETSALFNMFRGMLAFRPSERLTAAEIVESEWMQRWALPELGKGDA
ncbi:kinase-like domain-containing protein [Aspergillus karnatakaensis]|uniref:kinase-like domain-containing protein n=1 Tax=Aspergillus karnatakaensis TaxID=1810916 RepID=UPI003CCE071D